MGNIKKVKLPGGIDKTVTWIWLDPETGGQLRLNTMILATALKGFLATILPTPLLSRIWTSCNQPSIKMKNRSSRGWSNISKVILASKNGSKNMELTLVLR